MVARAELFESAVALLRDLPPFEQCRYIVQMEYDGHLTHDEGLQLLYLLVDDEMAPVRSLGSPLFPRREGGKSNAPHKQESGAGRTVSARSATST